MIHLRIPLMSFGNDPHLYTQCYLTPSPEKFLKEKNLVNL